MLTQKIKAINELQKIVEKLKSRNKKIVTTNGVFDILHIGHIRYLEQAKNLGDVLIVCVNSDSSVKMIKDPKRPLNKESDRAEAIAALQSVDYVTIFNENTPIKVLEKIKPDTHVKGGDYQIKNLIERNTVEKNNGKIVLIKKIDGYSTSDFIKKIVKLYKDSYCKKI